MLGSINDSTCLESLWSRGMTNLKTIGCKYQLVKDRKKVSEREKKQKRHFNYLYVKSKKKKKPHKSYHLMLPSFFLSPYLCPELEDITQWLKTEI